MFQRNEIHAHQDSVDIIVCVHNALEDVKRCIDSVIEYSNDPYHIIIVNDGKVIDAIGYFDEENFGRGFGEEDDFNLRAHKAGFKLAIVDNTYIYHAQSKSYTDEARKELSRKSGEILRQKHGAVSYTHLTLPTTSRV